jgi:hypothetical protein
MAGIMQAGMQVQRQVVIGAILVLALFAFEMFNFDTTRYALENLLGPIQFMGIGWATILAIAFCSIDFAGLVRMFTPQKGENEPKEVYYLMGAWLLGATMNAMMTWWAISLTLLSHDFGNEVLSREDLLRVVPIFVAVLVWLTRILFIGAFSVAGEKLLDIHRANKAAGQQPAVAASQARAMGQPVRAAGRPRIAEEFRPTTDDLPAFLRAERFEREERPVGPVAPTPAAHRRPAPAQPVAEPLNIATPEPTRRNDRVRQRPPVPNGTAGNGVTRPGLRGVTARGRNGVG